MKDKQLLDVFSKNLSRFFASTTRQRSEIYRSYDYRDGNQIHLDEASMPYQPLNTRPLRNGKTYCIVNVCAPLVRAVAGSEVMKPSTLDFLSTDPQFDSQADIIGDGVEWCQYTSGYYSERGIATEDAATCGLGGTVTYMDMTQKGFIAGRPVVERVFPGFMFYDNSPRGSQLNKKANWCGYADPVDREWLEEYIDENVDKRKQSEPTGASFKEYLLSFSRVQNQDEIDFIYHYFWTEWVPLYDIKNPFKEQNVINDIILNDEDLANAFGAVMNSLNLDGGASYWTVDKEGFNELKNTIELMQLMLQDMQIPDLEYSTRKGRCYYRAEIAGGYLIKKSRSYTQAGFPLNFITGYYEETSGQYYGLMRPISNIQDYLNITTSDFLSYVKAATHGGSSWVKGTGEALERIIKERLYEDTATPIPNSAEIIPKALPNSPEVLLNAINFFIEVMPRTLGLGQEFFGVITTGDMTESLYGRVMKQSFAVLENWKNNAASYDMRQGEIFEDLVRLIAEANDGIILPILSPNNEPQSYIKVRKQDLARSYAIRIIPRPLTADERQETFNQLTQLLPTMPPEVQRSMIPAMMKYSNLDFQDKQEFIKAATPPPPQPDPLNTATIEANIQFTQASAAKAAADAERTKAETADILRAASLADDKELADIRQKISVAELNEAKTQETLASVAQAIVGRMDSMQERMESKMEAMKPKDDGLHEKLEMLNRNYEEKMHQMMMTNAMLMRMDSQAEAQAAALEAQRQAVEQAALASKELAQTMKAPRKLVRDAQGNAMGVQVQE